MENYLKILQPISTETDSLPDYNVENFSILEELIRNVKVLNYLNQLSIHIFTKMIKFHFTNDDEKRHTYIAVDSILKFALNKMLNSNFDQMKEFFFASNNVIDYDFLRMIYNNEENDIVKSFSTEISLSVLEQYYYNSFQIKNKRNNFQISHKPDKQWHIKCTSNHNIKFVCDALMVHSNKFKSCGGNISQIQFIMIQNPIVYFFSMFNHKLNIWLFKLEDEEALMIITGPGVYNEERYQMDYIFELLLVHNLFNIIGYCQRVDIKQISLPLINKAKFSHSNIHTVLKDMVEFKHLFRSNNSDEYTLDINFSFNSISNIKFDVSKKSFSYIIDNAIIDEPFIYFYFNKFDCLLGGGFFNNESK